VNDGRSVEAKRKILGGQVRDTIFGGGGRASFFGGSQAMSARLSDKNSVKRKERRENGCGVARDSTFNGEGAL
jgi:hypothetical protein